EGRTITKRYVAVTANGERVPEEATLEHFLARGDGGAMRVVERGRKGAQLAQTRVQVKERRQGRARLELQPLTGRTHQLRVQLAAAGASIAGDRMYGGAPALRLLLHAAGLAFAHPRDARRIELVSPPPPELARFLAHGEEDAAGDDVLLQRALAVALQTRYRLLRARDAAEPTTAWRLL